MSAALPQDFLQQNKELRDAWEQIIKIQNLTADSNLKITQTRVVPWQIASGAFTAGGATIGAIVAAIALYLHIHT